jgi:hypothetical protein
MDTQTPTFPVPRSTAPLHEMHRRHVPAPAPAGSTRAGRVESGPIAGRAAESAVRRGVAAIGLAAVALIHVLDLPGKIEETPYLAVGYLTLIGVALLTAESLVRRDTVLGWLSALGLSAGTVAGFVATRTVGLPGATDDIGNWLEPLGLASLFVEGAVILLALTGLLRRR